MEILYLIYQADNAYMTIKHQFVFIIIRIVNDNFCSNIYLGVLLKCIGFLLLIEIRSYDKFKNDKQIIKHVRLKAPFMYERKMVKTFQNRLYDLKE